MEGFQISRQRRTVGYHEIGSFSIGQNFSELSQSEYHFRIQDNRYNHVTRSHGIEAREDYIKQRVTSSQVAGMPSKEMQELQKLHSKAKLDETDLLFLKENLPPTMFESFMLDRLASAARKEQNSLTHDNPEEHVHEPDPNFLKSSSRELSVEFQALKEEMQRRLAAPVRATH